MGFIRIGGRYMTTITWVWWSGNMGVVMSVGRRGNMGLVTWIRRYFVGSMSLVTWFRRRGSYGNMGVVT